MSNFVTFIEHLKSRRVSSIAFAIARRLLGQLFRYSSGSVFELKLKSSEQKQPSVELPVGYEYLPATEKDIPQCANEAGGTILQLKNRLEAGDLCFLIKRADRIANQFWVHWGDCFIRGAGYYITAKSDVAYVYAIVTSMDFRKKGLYKSGLQLLERTLRDLGSVRIVQFVERSNKAVLHTLPQVGYERTVDVFYLRLLGVGMTRATCCANSRVSWNFFLREKKSTYII